jgi:hypothetical protein
VPVDVLQFEASSPDARYATARQGYWGRDMRNAIAGPALMLLGGILVLETMFLGWISVTLVWQGQLVTEARMSGPNGALIGGCLLVIAGIVVASTKASRRTGFRVVAIVASVLVLIMVVVDFARSYGAESLVMATSQGTSDGDRLEEWIAHGATLNATRSIGLFLALAGGLLGMAGGVLAVRERKSRLLLLLAAPPPMPSPI